MSGIFDAAPRFVTQSFKVLPFHFMFYLSALLYSSNTWSLWNINAVMPAYRIMVLAIGHQRYLSRCPAQRMSFRQELTIVPKSESLRLRLCWVSEDVWETVYLVLRHMV